MNPETMVAFSFESVKSPFLVLVRIGVVVGSIAGAGPSLAQGQQAAEAAENEKEKESAEEAEADAAKREQQQQQSERLAQLAAGIVSSQKIVPEQLEKATPANIQIRVSLEKRNLKLLVDGKEALTCPICCGRRGMETATGEYSVASKTEKASKKNSYGSLIDSKGNLVLKGVYSNHDPIPVGAKFVPSPPNFTFVCTGGVVIHSGDANGTASSCGAIIIPTASARTLGRLIRKGTKVRIE